MSRHDADQGEMDILRSNNPGDDTLATFGQALRSSLLAPLADTASAELIPRLAAAARESATTTEAARAPRARPRPRLVLVARVGVVAALLPALMAGLAVAGVKLPEPAADVFEAVGVTLPNQDEGAGDDDPAAGGDSEDGAPGSEDGDGEAGGWKNDSGEKAKGRHGKNGKGRALGKRGLAPDQTNPKGSNPGGTGGNGKSQGDDGNGGEHGKK